MLDPINITSEGLLLAHSLLYILILTLITVGTLGEVKFRQDKSLSKSLRKNLGLSKMLRPNLTSCLSLGLSEMLSSLV